MRYEFATRPYHHQAAALAKMRRGGFGGALLMEPRTGKTKVAVDWMCVEALQHGVKRWVVVSPKRVMGVWKEEIGLHRGWVVGEDGTRRRLNIQVQLWDAAKRRQGPPRAPTSIRDLSIVVVNYEAFSGSSSEQTVRALLAWIGAKLPTKKPRTRRGRRRTIAPAGVVAPEAPVGMVLDESHLIKNPSAQTARMLVSLSPLFARRMILTGTPITGAERIADLRMQWLFLNPQRFKDLATDEDFRSHYGLWRNIGPIRKLIRFREPGLEDIKRRIKKDSFSITRRECFDMPDPIPRDILVTLSSRTREVYDTLKEEMIAGIKSGQIVASTAAVKSLRLSQIAAGVAKIDAENSSTGQDRLVRVGREKLEALAELLEEWFEHDEKVVVAARFRADIVSILKMVKEKCPRASAYRLDGTVPAERMHEELKLFREESGPAIFVIQPKAGGVGIDLSSASRFVWYTLDLSWTNYKQCSDRVALNRTVDMVHILAKNTVDIGHLRALQGDGQIGRWIVDHPDEL
jgi:hypothetical protein